jgi:hypothetical protein
MLSTDDKEMAFKKISLINRIYFRSTLKEMLANRESMSAEEIFETPRNSMYEPGLLEKERVA